LLQGHSKTDTLKAMLNEHHELLAEYERIAKETPDSTAVELPFEPGYRPGPLEAWLQALAGTMARLRQLFRDEDRLAELGRYPVSPYGEAINFGHGGRRSWLIAGLEEQSRLLARELEALGQERSVEDHSQIRARWREDGWPRNLKAAREHRGQTQKQAAAACLAAVETYRKWEEGRTPHSRNISAIVSYVRTAAVQR